MDKNVKKIIDIFDSENIETQLFIIQNNIDKLKLKKLISKAMGKTRKVKFFTLIYPLNDTELENVTKQIYEYQNAGKNFIFVLLVIGESNQFENLDSEPNNLPVISKKTFNQLYLYYN